MEKSSARKQRSEWLLAARNRPSTAKAMVCDNGSKVKVQPVRSAEEWKAEAKEFGQALAAVMGIALTYTTGNGASLDRKAAADCLRDPLQMFRRHNKTDLTGNIQLLLEALEQGKNIEDRAADVVRSLSKAYPNGR